VIMFYYLRHLLRSLVPEHFIRLKIIFDLQPKELLIVWAEFEIYNRRFFVVPSNVNVHLVLEHLLIHTPLR